MRQKLKMRPIFATASEKAAVSRLCRLRLAGSYRARETPINQAKRILNLSASNGYSSTDFGLFIHARTRFLPSLWHHAAGPPSPPELFIAVTLAFSLSFRKAAGGPQHGSVFCKNRPNRESLPHVRIYSRQEDDPAA